MRYILIGLALLLASTAQAADFRFGGGVGIANSGLDQKSTAWNTELLTTLWDQPVILGYLNEGHKDNPHRKRDGVYLQGVKSFRISYAMNIDIAGGVYASASTLSTNDNLGYGNSHNLNGLLSVIVRYDRWHIELMRIVTTDNSDADVVLVGITF